MKAGASRPSALVRIICCVKTLPAAIALFLVLAGNSGAAVPGGFQPLSFTAVSERDFWLLGTVPCQRA
jgi:hypothetical protein